MKDEEGEIVIRGGDENQFRYGRRGDQMMIAFQCDLCHFRNLCYRDPIPGDITDEGLICGIRRATLDSFWSRATSTVQGNYYRVRELHKLGQRIGLSSMSILPEMGPYPLGDWCGMAQALILLEKSLDPGQNVAAGVQFDTVRRLRTASGNAYKAGRKQQTQALFERGLKKVVATDCPTDGVWFTRFLIGAEVRMGKQIKQDLGLSIEVMKVAMDLLERSWETATNGKERHQVVVTAMIFLGTFCWGLRGEELLLISVGGTRKVWTAVHAHKISHVMLALMGTRKGLSGGRMFLLPASKVTRSGLQPGLWLARLLSVTSEIGRPFGYLLDRDDGRMPRLMDYEEQFMEVLLQVQVSAPGVIPSDLDVREAYGISRSGRRGVTTHLRNQNLSEPDIELNQMWRKTELNVGRSFQPSKMLAYYTEIAQSLPTLLRFTQRQ